MRLLGWLRRKNPKKAATGPHIKYPGFFARVFRRKKPYLVGGKELPSEMVGMEMEHGHAQEEGKIGSRTMKQIEEGFTPGNDSVLGASTELIDKIIRAGGVKRMNKSGFGRFMSNAFTPQKAYGIAGVTTTVFGSPMEKRLYGGHERREVPKKRGDAGPKGTEIRTVKQANKKIKEWRENLLALSAKYNIPPRQFIEIYNMKNGTTWTDAQIFGVKLPEMKLRQKQQAHPEGQKNAA